jgi:hypothetical protein
MNSPLQRFIVHETIIREYEVMATDFDDAVAKGLDLDADHPYFEESLGLTHVQNMDTGKTLAL